jgi:hypothetical protein
MPAARHYRHVRANVEWTGHGALTLRQKTNLAPPTNPPQKCRHTQQSASVFLSPHHTPRGCTTCDPCVWATHTCVHEREQRGAHMCPSGQRGGEREAGTMPWGRGWAMGMVTEKKHSPRAQTHTIHPTHTRHARPCAPPPVAQRGQQLQPLYKGVRAVGQGCGDCGPGHDLKGRHTPWAKENGERRKTENRRESGKPNVQPRILADLETAARTQSLGVLMGFKFEFKLKVDKDGLQGGRTTLL